MMKADEIDQAWTVAYAIAFAMTTLGGEIRNARQPPQEIDSRARALADQAARTIVERVDQAAARGKK